MQLMAALKKPVQITVAAALLVCGSVTTAETIEDKPSAGAMIIDTVLARPLYFLLSQGGALVYGATLPFTLVGGNADEAAEVLVVTPLQAAFVRCLGCGEIENEVGNLEEGKGKTIRHMIMASAGLTSYDEKAADTSGTSASGGLYLGTHFSLADSSRFDVLLGYRSLGTVKLKSGAARFEDSVSSVQVVSRFGKRAFWGLDIMGKLGLHSWKTNRDTPKSSASGAGFFYGLGAEKFINRDIRAGIEHTRYSISDGGYEASLNTTDLNVTFMF